MKFSLAATTLLAGLAAAAPVTAPRALEAHEEPHLAKRVLDPFSIAIYSGIIFGLVAESASFVLTQMGSIIGDIAGWDDARERFTTGTVESMIKGARPDEAAICCNVGYSVSDESKIRERASVDFKSGALKTDYDCFFYSGKTFQLEGDGGFINIAIQRGPCLYDRGTLTCL